MLISVGWLPPYWCPSRRLLRSRLEGRGLVTRSKIAPKTGAASPPMARDRDHWQFPASPLLPVRLRGDRDCPCDRPGEGHHLPCDGDHDLVHVLASRTQQAVPLAQPQLGLPGDGPHLGGHLLKPELQVPTDLRRIAIGPGALDERPPSMAAPGFRDAALVSVRAGRVLRRRETEIA